MREPHETSPLANLECPPVSDEDRRRARMVVCRNATDRDDAAALLAMLGLLDEEPRPPACAGCGRPFSDSGREGTIPHKRAGRCSTCYSKRYSGSDMIDAVDVREHIAELRRCGLSVQAIADRAGIPIGTMHSIVYHRGGRQVSTVSQATASRILAVVAVGSAS